MKLLSPGFSPSRLSGGLATILRRVAAVLLAFVAICTSLTPAHAVTINFILPLPEGEEFTSENLPYTESGYVFTDVFGSTGHVTTFDYTVEDERVADSYLALGDWDPTSVTSRILVTQEASALFSLVSVDYLHSGAGRLEFVSSKGGTLLTPQFSSSGTLNFGSNPLWQDITHFTITGLAGDPVEYEFGDLDEAIFRSMVLVPEPSMWAVGLAGIACGGWGMWRRRKRSPRSRALTAAVSCLALTVLFLTPAHAVTIDWVTVGDPGNAADTTGYGTVNYEYRIGKYEVTIQQYTDFLNAAAKGNPYELYNPTMGTDGNVRGISRSGAYGSYTYSVMTNGGSSANRPITYVSWWDAARFANWMHNGQGAGSTETGAYTLNGAMSGPAPAKNAGAKFYIPTENEWYKAAFYKSGGTNAGYWNYATQSDSAPGNTIGSGSNQANARNRNQDGAFAVTQSSNYSTLQNYLTDVGAFSSSPSGYGTFDQNGNVWEWNDLSGTPDVYRGIRGGSWQYDTLDLPASYRLTDDATYESPNYGFRLASPVPVPEPSTWVMGLAGIACGGWQVFRRRQQRKTCLALLAHVSLALIAACLCTTPAHAVTINFILPVPAGEIFTAKDLPYTESGYVFTDVFGSTGHVFTFDDEGVVKSYLGLGDWDTRTVTSQIRVTQEANALFSLVSIDYLHHGPGRLQFLSSKGGTLLTPEFGPSGIETLNFSADPLWQDITNFTITGLLGDPDEYEFAEDEAFIESMVFVPEPATCVLVVAGLACGGLSIWRRRRRSLTDAHPPSTSQA